ncbi:hypothetical protein L1D34_11905 [Vibrio mediterranei]|uniref:hypothetical protein n=1 Tax=Vibrio mediterranei TaxID=689 RepID=UPI001EFE19CB|nr:hypothetical protein [Vibrio mediterranei]
MHREKNGIKLIQNGVQEMRLLCLSLVTLAVLSGCKSIPIIFMPDHNVSVSGSTLIFDGPISGDSVLEALRVVRNSGANIEKIRITSPGGDVPSGIELGYFIKENNLDVEVDKLCFSACANYVIPAAKTVLIKKGSLIGWHGGPRQSDELWQASVSSTDKEELMTFISRLREKEEVFFEYVDVDPDITVYGQTSSKKCQLTEETHGWYYSKSDLAKMGVTNVVIEGELASSIEYQGDTINACLMPEFKSI